MSFSTMATGMEYESPYKSDSPFSYEVEEGELSSGSGRSSPGTVRDNASDCGMQQTIKWRIFLKQSLQ